MANIGATTAFYKVETSLTRANNEVSKSMERLATGKQNANAGDRSSYVAMADTFRLDFVGTKAGIKGASVVMGYLETGMRVLDSASALLARLQELAVLGANDTNTAADTQAIDAEAEAIGDEFHRLMSTSTYKGKDVFSDTANGFLVSMGGRNQEMTFGLGRVKYSDLYLHSYLEYAKEKSLAGNNDNEKIFNAKVDIGNITSDGGVNGGKQVLVAGAKYEVAGVAFDTDADAVAFTEFTAIGNNMDTIAVNNGTSGDKFTADASGRIAGAGKAAKQEGQLVFTASEGMLHTNQDTDKLTALVEAVQARINTARVEAGSQYAALESAVNYTTDLTAQYELGYNTVNDVNFSMETAHLAKNQILQQAATAMLAQANQGQQGLLQLIS